MRAFFAVDSFFQLIIATNLRITIFKDYEADIGIYSSTPYAKKICENLHNTEVYDEVFFIDSIFTRVGDKYSFVEKIPKYFLHMFNTVFSSVLYARKLMFDHIKKYDLFLFNGVGALPECLFYAFKNMNHDIKCYRFEDSYVSYTKIYGAEKTKFRIAFEMLFNRIYKRTKLDDAVIGYYFTMPELVQILFPYPILNSPRLSRENNQLISILNKTFSYDSLEDSYSEKFIFFESGDSYFSSNDEDICFIKILADIVGSENILIKRHPRCKENRFRNLGVHIAKFSLIPWELIQLNIKMDDKVFITTTSAAALSPAIYFNDHCKSILLFEAMKNKPTSVTDSMRNYMKKYQEIYGREVLIIPRNIKEYKEVIKII